MANIKIKQCKQCGSDYEWQHGKMGSLRGTCSVKCNKARVRERNLHLARSGYFKDRYTPKKDVQGYCPVCSTPFVGNANKKYCSVRCGDEARARKSGAIPVSERNALRRNAALKTCPQCQTKFLPSRGDTHSKGPQDCCSVDCALVRRRRLKPKIYDYPKANFCDECRRCIGVKRKYCDDCNLRRMEKACRDCGVVVGKGSQRCDSCRDCAATEARKRSRKRSSKSPSVRASRARSKALRRARKRIATVERFDPYEIFNRDGWRCYICGIETPKRLRGTLDERAPELDHINPIALGGQHSRQNTACCCRKCNAAKGVRPLEQILKAA